MRGSGFLLGCAAAACAGAAPAAVARNAADRCVEPGDRVLARTEAAVVVRQAGQTFGCLAREGRRRALDAPRDPDLTTEIVETLALSDRRLVAEVSSTSVNIGEGSSALVVLDLARRSDRLIAPIGSSFAPDGPSSFDTAAVRPDGSVAWTQTDGFAGRETVSLRRRNAGSSRSTVLAASGVDPRSLRRFGGRIAWTADGVRRTAALGPQAPTAAGTAGG